MSGDVTDVLCAVVPPRCIGLLFHEEAQYLSPLYPRCQPMVVRGTLQPGEERQMRPRRHGETRWPQGDDMHAVRPEMVTEDAEQTVGHRGLAAGGA